MKFKIELAGKIVEIQSCYPEIKELCRDYCCDDLNLKPDLSVFTNELEIRAEQKQSQENEYAMEYLETLSVLRKIAENFPLSNRMVFHGAAISYENRGYIFAAPSGVGKSTHIALWKKYLGEKVEIVNGDKPILCVEEKEICVHGTPWAGKEKWQKNRSVSLNGICFIKRGMTSSIRQLKPEDSLDMLFRQVYLPADQKAAEMTMKLLDKLVNKIPFYLLVCDVSEEAVRCSFEGMTGLDY